MNRFLNLFASQQPSQKRKEIALVTNFTSCKLGFSIFSEFQKVIETVGVAHDGSDHQGGFSAFLNEQQDRDRLVAFLKQNGMVVKYLIWNQPFKLRPTVDDPQLADSDGEKDEKKVEELKDKVRILVEAPLFTVADLVQHKLVDGKILLLSHP